VFYCNLTNHCKERLIVLFKTQKGLEMLRRLYHGSIVSGLEYLEPRHRYTPGVENNQSPEGVYASDDPSFAAGHAFAWQSSDGILLGYFSDDESAPMTLQLPVDMRRLLDQSISVYTVEPKDFVVLSDVQPSGRTYRSLEQVKCYEERRFESIWEAFTTYGGQIRVVAPSSKFAQVM
jgi:hypothetical protein